MRIAYHCTNIDPATIKRDGWKVGSGFTVDNMFGDLYETYLPDVPVFITSDKSSVWDEDARYCIKLDIGGLELYPDFGSLPDYDAYYDCDGDEPCFYWKDGSDFGGNAKLRRWVEDNCDDLTMYAADFTGELSLELLGTACVDGKLLTPEKIISRNRVANSSKRVNIISE